MTMEATLIEFCPPVLDQVGPLISILHSLLLFTQAILAFSQHTSPNMARVHLAPKYGSTRDCSGGGLGKWLLVHVSGLLAIISPKPSHGWCQWMPSPTKPAYHARALSVEIEPQTLCYAGGGWGGPAGVSGIGLYISKIAWPSSVKPNTKCKEKPACQKDFKKVYNKMLK